MSHMIDRITSFALDDQTNKLNIDNFIQQDTQHMPPFHYATMTLTKSGFCSVKQCSKTVKMKNSKQTIKAYMDSICPLKKIFQSQ